MKLRTPEAGFFGALGIGLFFVIMLFFYSLIAVVVFLWEWAAGKDDDWTEVCAELRERWKP